MRMAPRELDVTVSRSAAAVVSAVLDVEGPLVDVLDRSLVDVVEVDGVVVVGSDDELPRSPSPPRPAAPRSPATPSLATVEHA